jgi:hypothetical protein
MKCQPPKANAILSGLALDEFLRQINSSVGGNITSDGGPFEVATQNICSMAWRNHPPLDGKGTRIIVALIIRDVFPQHAKVADADSARPVARLRAIGRLMREEALPGHVLGMTSGHATEFGIPD